AEDVCRLMLCARCSRQVWLCRDCDRGQRYCEGECRAASRRESVKRAGAAYQRGRRGRRLHAARAQRYRERKRATAAKFSDQKVTHHAVTQGEGRGHRRYLNGPGRPPISGFGFVSAALRCSSTHVRSAPVLAKASPKPELDGRRPRLRFRGWGYASTLGW